jgi:glycosyltransferase involved in cell wall biosynthesis
MNICHLTLNFIDYERRIKNQAESSAKSGHYIKIIALGKSANKLVGAQNGISIRRIITPFTKGGPLKFIHFNLKVFLVLLFERLQIVHCHDLWTLPAVYFLRIIKKFNIVYDAHEYYEGLEIFNRNRIRKKLWMLAEQIAIRKVEVLITVSEPIAGLYHKKYPHLQKIEVIRNLPQKESHSESTNHNILPKTTDKLIIFQGHFKPGRGLIKLIESMTLLDKVHLVLIGGGEIENDIREKIAHFGLKNKVSLIGYIPTDQLITTTSRADLGVVLFEKTSLNYTYALPNKFFEYIMAGIPILASNLDTFTEYLESYGLGMSVNPDNVEDIAQSIKLMLSDENKLKEWRDNARKASRILNWENESIKMNQIYEDIQR